MEGGLAPVGVHGRADPWHLHVPFLRISMLTVASGGERVEEGIAIPNANNRMLPEARMLLQLDIKTPFYPSRRIGPAPPLSVGEHPRR